MNAVITGASGDIGQAIARAYAQKGYKLALCFHENKQAAEDLAYEITRGGGMASAFSADLTSEQHVMLLEREVIERIGEPDVLVNNAGVSSQMLFGDVSLEEYDRVMDTNVKSMFLTTRAFLPYMIRNKKGSIINIFSMWGQVGGSCEVIYSASKAAIIGMTKALAKEVGPSNIRVNCIAPGVIDTSMNAMHSRETMEELIDETPLMRLGTPRDIANVAVFLAGPRSTFMTGQVLGVNGGIVI